MKTSNKILVLAVAVFTINFFYNNFSFSSKLRNERREKIDLSGEMLTRKISYSEVTGVQFKGKFDVILIPDSSNMIEIKADKNILPLIHVDNWYGILDIILNNDAVNRGVNRVKIVFHFKKLSSILSEDSKIICDSIINRVNQFDIDCRNSYIVLNLKVNTLNVKAEQNSKCLLAGKAGYAMMVLDGHADLDANNLLLNKGDLVETNNSTASLKANDKVRKTVSGNSTVTLTGNKSINIENN